MTGTLQRAVAAAVVAAALVAAGPAAASHPPRGATWSDEYLESADGTRLHADVFRPAGLPAERRTPVVLVVSPYLGLPSSEDPGQPHVLEWYRRVYELAIARGYTVAQVSFRGTGASSGCTDFGGPGDRGDVVAAIDWAAAAPWSDGRVGMAGHSYDGFAAVVGLAERRARLRAAVLMAPAVDLYRGVFMNGVGYLQSPAVGSYYQAFGPIPPLGDLDQVVSGVSADPSCAGSVPAETQDPDHSTPFWRDRDLTDRAAGSPVPVLWAHGFLDGRDDYSSVRPDNFLSVWTRLSGPRRAWFGQFSHLVPGESNTFGEPDPVGRGRFAEEALDWLDAHVTGDPAAAARVAAEPPVAVQEGARGEWRSEPGWPPPGARAAELEIAPGTYPDGPGNKAEQGEDQGGSCSSGVKARCNPLSRTGQGSWSFSPPLAGDAHVAGPARLSARLAAPADARVIALVYDVDADHRATLLTRGAALIGDDGAVDFELYPQDWRLRRGHRIGVLLTGSDDFYFAPGETGAQVSVTGGTLSLPLIPLPRGAGLPGDPSRAVAERTSFQVDPGLTGGRTTRLRTPALPRERLVLRVRPRRARARRLVRLRLAVTTASGRPVRGAQVRVGRRLLRTGADGSAVGRARFFRAGRRELRASAHGHGRTRAWLSVAR